jgi:hypothetical protein
VRLLKYATPVKAKTSAPAPDLPTSCAALTWRGFETATRTGSRERGSGRRQTLDRQQDRGRASAPSGEATIREPFGRLRWSKEGWRYATGGSLFHYHKPGGSPFSLSHGPQI